MEYRQNVSNFFNTCVANLHFGSRNDDFHKFLAHIKHTFNLPFLLMSFAPNLLKVEYVILEHAYYLCSREAVFFNFVFVNLFFRSRLKKCIKILKNQIGASSGHKEYYSTVTYPNFSQFGAKIDDKNGKIVNHAIPVIESP